MPVARWKAADGRGCRRQQIPPKAKNDEVPIFSWIEYPDRAAGDAANKKMGEDPNAQNMDMPFDGKRMF